MSQGQARPKLFYGWIVLGGLFITAALGPMGRYILTVFFPFIMEDPGWSRETIGLGFTIHFWAYALLAILTGKLIDHIGGRVTILIGGVLTLLGLLLLSSVEAAWQFFLVFGVLMAGAVSMTHFVPNTSLVRKWFIRKAGLATGLVTLGTVIGFACLPPLISYLSVDFGWRTASVICAVGFGIPIMAMAAFIIRNAPETMGLYPDGGGPLEDEARPLGSLEPGVKPEVPVRWTTAQALRSKNFWYFLVAYSVTGIPLQGILGHVIIWGVEMGFSRANSGLIMAALTIPSMPVRVLAGWLGDRFGKRRVLILFNLYTTIIWFLGWLFITDKWSFLAFCILLGFAYSAPFSLYTPFLGDMFGRMIVGTLMGVLTLGHGIIGGVGPYLWGWIADRMGSYLLNCPISAGCYVIVTLSLFLLKPPEGSDKPRCCIKGA